MHRVLVVDDDFEVRGMFSAAFELQGIDADVAENGIEAMRLLRLYPDRYCLLVLDLNVPAPDGIRIAQHVREFKPDLPVIVLTDDDEAAERIRNAELARTVSLIIRKPTVPVAIVGYMHSHCARRVRRADREDVADRETRV